jgi:hypothetical protein
MKRLEKSKVQLYQMLLHNIEKNPDEAWRQTFLLFQELINHLYTYEEKAELFDYFNSLKETKGSIESIKKIGCP